MHAEVGAKRSVKECFYVRCGGPMELKGLGSTPWAPIRICLYHLACHAVVAREPLCRRG